MIVYDTPPHHMQNVLLYTLDDACLLISESKDYVCVNFLDYMDFHCAVVGSRGRKAACPCDTRENSSYSKYLIKEVRKLCISLFHSQHSQPTLYSLAYAKEIVHSGNHLLKLPDLSCCDVAVGIVSEIGQNIQVIKKLAESPSRVRISESYLVNSLRIKREADGLISRVSKRIHNSGFSMDRWRALEKHLAYFFISPSTTTEAQEDLGSAYKNSIPWPLTAFMESFLATIAGMKKIAQEKWRNSKI